MNTCPLLPAARPGKAGEQVCRGLPKALPYTQAESVNTKPVPCAAAADPAAVPILFEALWSNKAPAIRRYVASTSPSWFGAPWCAYFVSYVSRRAGGGRPRL